MRALVVAALLLAAPVMAEDLYVCTGGSDTNGCTNNGADCCASIYRAITQATGIGTEAVTIEVEDGTYTSGGATTGGCSGYAVAVEDEVCTAAFPCTINAATTRGVTVEDAGGEALCFHDSDYWTINGIYFDDTNADNAATARADRIDCILCSL